MKKIILLLVFLSIDAHAQSMRESISMRDGVSMRERDSAQILADSCEVTRLQGFACVRLNSAFCKKRDAEIANIQSRLESEQRQFRRKYGKQVD